MVTPIETGFMTGSRWFLFAIAMGFSLLGSAQCLLKGQVLDEDLKPVTGVLIVHEEITMFTNIDGEFEIQSNKNQVAFKASALGFEAIDTTLNCSNSQVQLVLQSKLLEQAVVAAQQQEIIDRLNAIEDFTIYEAKKAELIIPDSRPVNAPSNSARQVFAEVPGLNIWESDGAGLQIGIGGRGLDPNRTSNFNTRQNGYDISADPHGYPESYYTPPIQAVERIVLLRGAASLQFGPQFGGMINFQIKSPTTRKLAVISEHTVGSWNALNTFNLISQDFGKTSYIGYFQYKQGDSWRPNSAYDYFTGYAHVQHEFSNRLKLSIEATHMNYLSQQAGGLTDTQFLLDPTVSTRDRNWFRVNWNVLSGKLEWKLNNTSEIQVVPFIMEAERTAIGFLGLTTRTDPGTERNIIQGDFNNWGVESRYKKRFEWKGIPQNLVAGVRYFDGNNRSIQGFGTRGNDADFSIIQVNDQESSDYTFDNTNVAAFAESILRPNEIWSITPGVRFEFLETASQGEFVQVVKDGAGNVLPTYPRTITEPRSARERTFFLFGMGLERKVGLRNELYFNWSRNYRGINFSDVRIVNPKQIVADDIDDEKGFNMDLGWKHTSKNWGLDFTLFHLSYRNRIGNTLERLVVNPILGEEVFQVRKNLGNAQIFGAELFLKANLIQLVAPDTSRKWGLQSFVNYSHIISSYTDSNSAIEGNKVEFVPDHNLKIGTTLRFKGFSITHQFTYISEQFTDATNARFRSDPNGILGEIPEYWVHDLGVKIPFRKWYLQGGVNNFLDQYYFTRRATGYPGPGIIPSDPRNFYITVGFKVWDY
ncbi:MAG: TonB-dependent receptor [Flavobacteriales bacterium]|nr:TonB-dependent receptor [Flavobacteriales bacterium]